LFGWEAWDWHAQLAKRFNDNFGFNHLVKYSFNSLTTKKDFEETRAFFEGKGELSSVVGGELMAADTKKFKSALAQTLDAIEASASWLERDQKDVEEVSTAPQRGTYWRIAVAQGEEVPVKGIVPFWNASQFSSVTWLVIVVVLSWTFAVFLWADLTLGVADGLIIASLTKRTG
jgi:hypothetical protein